MAVQEWSLLLPYMLECGSEKAQGAGTSGKGSEMNSTQLQRVFYLCARSVGDINAARHGRIGERLLYRATYRVLRRALRGRRRW
jgi:hypothetical protein